MIDEIDNFKAMILSKAVHQQAISTDEVHQFELNILTRPRLVEEKEKLRLGKWIWLLRETIPFE